MESESRLEFLLHRVTEEGKYVRGFNVTENTTRTNGYETIDGIVYLKIGVEHGKPTYRLVCCPEDIVDAVICDGTVEVSDQAFMNCISLKSVEIPDSVKDLGMATFMGCKNLEHVKFGNGLIEIQMCVFQNCENLKRIEIPEGITAIQRNAFTYSGLESVVLASSIKTIGEDVFFGTKLSEIFIPKSVNEIHKMALGLRICRIELEKFDVGFVEFITSLSNMEDGLPYYIEMVYNGKNLYLPRYVTKSKLTKLKAIAADFFNSNAKYASTFETAPNPRYRNAVAFIEYEKFNSDKAKEYLKKNSKKVICQFIEEGKEEDVVKMLKTGFVSKVTLKTLLEKTEKSNMTIAKAYIMQAINENDKKNCFSI